jgi:hypothetical protein
MVRRSDHRGRMRGCARELNGQVPPTLLSQVERLLGVVVPERKAKLPVQAIN